MNASRKRVIAGLALALSSCASPAAAPELVHVASLSALREAIARAPDTGQLIILARGVYQQSRSIEIRHKHHLTISGATTDFRDTVLNGPGINDMRVINNIRVYDSDDVTLRNLTIKNSAYHAVRVTHGSDFFRANNLKTWDNGESGFKVDSPARKRAHGSDAYSDYGTIEHCVIGFTHHGTRGVVEGIDIVGAVAWDVRDNRLQNIRKANGRAAYAIFAKGNAKNIVIENNIVRNSSVGLSFGGGGTGHQFFRNGDTRYETRGGVIRHNTVYDLSDTGIYLNKAHDFDVYANTVIRNGKHTGAIVARYPATRGRIYHNVVSAPIKRRDGGHAFISNNRFVPDDTPIPASAEAAFYELPNSR